MVPSRPETLACYLSAQSVGRNCAEIIGPEPSRVQDNTNNTTSNDNTDNNNTTTNNNNDNNNNNNNNTTTNNSNNNSSTTTTNNNNKIEGPSVRPGPRLRSISEISS